MIKDSIEHLTAYTSVHPHIQNIIRYMQHTNLTALEVGTYPIIGNELYVMKNISETVCKDDGIWESHKNYIDLQYVLKGGTYFGYSRAETLSATSEYDAPKDIQLFAGTGDFIHLTSGDFILFSPQEAHMCNICYGKTALVEKVVFKIQEKI